MDYSKSAREILATYGKARPPPVAAAPAVRRERNEPTAERLRHGQFTATDTMTAGVKVWQQRDPLKLDQYHAADRISGSQYSAALDYRELGVDAGKCEKGAFKYGAVGGRGEMSDELARLDREFRDASRAVGSYIMAVEAVCLSDEHAPIEEVREGLDRLARHFATTRGRRG